MRGVTVAFQNSPSITDGNETVNYNATTKQLTFNIAAGQTTANDIINALKKQLDRQRSVHRHDRRRRQRHRHHHAIPTSPI